MPRYRVTGSVNVTISGYYQEEFDEIIEADSPEQAHDFIIDSTDIDEDDMDYDSPDTDWDLDVQEIPEGMNDEEFMRPSEDVLMKQWGEPQLPGMEGK